MSSALLSLATTASVTGILPDAAEVEAAVTAYVTTNPSSIYRVKLQGFEVQYMSGAWDSNDNPVSGGATDGLGSGTAKTEGSRGGSQYIYNAPTAFSLSFHAGAKIVRGAGKVTIQGNAVPSGLTAATIKYLTKDGSPVTPAITVTDVVSNAGQVSFTSPELLATSNILAVSLGNVFVRLSSAYVKSDVEIPELG